MLQSQCYIITGMHRSGTSLVARMFHLSGLHIGKDLLPADAHNPYGYYEDKEILDVHQRIYQAQGSPGVCAEHPVDTPGGMLAELYSIAERRSKEHQGWGFKDPRACMLINAWALVEPAAIWIGVVRHPAAVASCISRTYQIEPSASVLMTWLRAWYAHNTRIFRMALSPAFRTYILCVERLSAVSPVTMHRLDIKVQSALACFRTAYDSNLLHSTHVDVKVVLYGSTLTGVKGLAFYESCLKLHAALSKLSVTEI